MKSLGLILDPVFEEHETGPGHPERPERLRVLRQAIARWGVGDALRTIELESADDDLLGLAHEADHIERVEEACRRGDPSIDTMDTAICTDSSRVARLAAGSLVALCRDVARGASRRGFAAIRPPGHHAERDLAMGFCLFNNVAIAANYLRRSEGIARVMIVDWDVHHGNGTQHIFEADPDVFFFSVHQSPLYPGTGARSESGRDSGQGATLNCPLPPGAGEAEFLAALRDELIPAAERFRPEFVLVSAGFDAHRADPLGGLEVSTEAYAEATRIVCDIADRWARGRVVSTLEGGYDLDALTECVLTHLGAMLDGA